MNDATSARSGAGQTNHAADGLISRTHRFTAAGETLLKAAKRSIAAQIAENGGIDASQHVAHGLAWFATCVEALRQMARWASELQHENRFGATEQLILELAASEYANQLRGGIAMSQGETIRPAELGLSDQDLQAFDAATPVARDPVRNEACRQQLAALLRQSMGATTIGDTGLDETHAAMREEMRRFSRDRIEPQAHGWHLANLLIPADIIKKLGELGVFGVSIPEQWGGLGLGKEAMCIVSEELSRGYIGVGSLGTRSEIAAELILQNGTDEQKAHYLARIASGELLPTAVFTEPDTGSDLGALKTRADRRGETYFVTGQKTWITHAVRAELMTLLVRTDPKAKGYRGLSMLLAEKPAGSDDDLFPAPGMAGSEIEVLGYRGMREYEISFEDFEVPAGQLLGAEEGQGFKQLMSSFEAARIQTAARSIGVAQSALDLALSYALERQQFGKDIFSFPRVANKIVMMAVEIMIARQLTYYAARAKDQGRRCDLEAGMAKLLAARVAWAAADNAVQIHGGNGFALEHPVSRILCDARILSIFEGAAEIQAQVIARRLLDGGN